MSINISFVDLRLADTLSKFNSIEMLDPAKDVLVNAVLEQLGFDITKEIEYLPSKHRSMSGVVSIDFQACGEMNRDRKYNHLRDVTMRTVCAGMSDISLAREMALLQGNKATYRSDEKWDDGSRAKVNDPRYFSEEQLLEYGFSMGDEDSDPLEGLYIEANWEDDLRAIRQLEDIRNTIRGVK